MLKLQISDKKALGVKTKGRQFSVLYKIDCQNFKQVLNTALSNGFISPVSGDEPYKIGNIKQTFTSYMNSIPLTVTLTRDEFGESFTTQGEAFLKILSYKFYQAYLDYCINQKTNVSLINEANSSVVQIDETDLTNSKNLYLVKNFSKIFGTPQKPNETISTFIQQKEKDSKGRLKPTEEVMQETVPTYSVTDEFFNGFSLLPLSLTLIETNDKEYMSSSNKLIQLTNFSVEATELDNFLIATKNKKHN